MNIKIVTIVVTTLVLIVPNVTFAETGAGIRPNNFFYFLDIVLEKTSLFFTFNREEKVKKALMHAEERIAEIRESLEEGDVRAVAISLSGYENKIDSIAKNISKIKYAIDENVWFAVFANDIEEHHEFLVDILENSNASDKAKDTIGSIAKFDKEISLKFEEYKNKSEESEEIIRQAREKKEELLNKERGFTGIFKSKRSTDGDSTSEQSGLIPSPPTLPDSTNEQTSNTTPQQPTSDVSGYIPPPPALPTNTSEQTPNIPSQQSNTEPLDYIPPPPPLPE